ncbi:MAG: hypothetical protein C4517_11505 [Stygiobacter sp.]|nr:MAG: hypothetical protein C4517_11505 [Stygiobacter sp.]
MQEFEKVESIALYDAGILIKNVFTKDKQTFEYEHPFHTFDYGAYDIEGIDLQKLGTVFGLNVSNKIEAMKLPIFKSLKTLDDFLLDNHKIIDVAAKVDNSQLLAIRITTILKKKKKLISLTYCGKYSVIWHNE